MTGMGALRGYMAMTVVCARGEKDGDIMDFYLSGDVAPLGRFVWRWRE